MESMNDFDKIIKDKIGSVEEMPPAHLWANISKEIAVPPAAAIPFYKSSKFVISAAVASVIIVMGTMWFFASNKNIEDKKQLTEYNIAEETIDNEQVVETDIEKPQSIEVVEKQENVSKKKPVDSSNIENATIDIATFDDQPTNDSEQYKRKKMSYSTTEIANNSQEQLPQTNSTSKKEAVLITSLTPLMKEGVIANNEVDDASEKDAVSKIEKENNVDVENEKEVVQASSLAVVEKETNNTIATKEENKEYTETAKEENEEQAIESKLIVSCN